MNHSVLQYVNKNDLPFILISIKLVVFIIFFNFLFVLIQLYLGFCNYINKFLIKHKFI
jgi:hypothetical protein